MNLVLFDPAEIQQPLARSDRRARHILCVLGRKNGDAFDAGLINGPRGKATIRAITPTTVEFSFEAGAATSTACPITLIVGLPRPQTARDILRDASTLGVGELHFVATEKGERSYRQSSLWSSGEARRLLIAGAEQAFDTHVPALTAGRPLPDVLTHLERKTTRLALDNYESPRRLGAADLLADQPCVVAIGSERGWSAAERRLLREHGFAFVHLGPRVLRTETAAIAALTLIRAKLALM